MTWSTLEIKRKLFHLLLGSAVAALVFLLPSDLSSLILAVFASMIFVFSRSKNPVFLWLLQNFERPGEQPFKGALNLTIGSAVAALFFPPLYAAGGILVLAVGDSFSTIIGYHHGKRKIYGEKTLEGALAFFASSTLALSLFFPLSQAAVASLISMLIELYSPLDDNLLIPSAAALILRMP